MYYEQNRHIGNFSADDLQITRSNKTIHYVDAVTSVLYNPVLSQCRGL